MCDLAARLHLSPSGLTRRLDGLVQGRATWPASPASTTGGSPSRCSPRPDGPRSRRPRPSTSPGCAPTSSTTSRARSCDSSAPRSRRCNGGGRSGRRWRPPELAFGSLPRMVTPEHAQQVIETYCKAESAKDRDTWLSLFAPDATHEDPVGAPVNRGIEAIGAFFDAGAGQMDLDLHTDRAADRRRRRGARVPRGARRPRRRAPAPVADRRPPGVRRRRPHHRVARVLRPRGHPPRPGLNPAVTPPDDVYTHGHHESVLRSHQWRTAENSAGYLLDALAPGTRVLDVGLRPGHDHRRLRAAGRARPRSSVSTAPTKCSTAARDAARDAGVDNVEFAVGDVYALDAARRVVRRRARAPGAAAPHRSGRGAARDASGVRAGRRRRGARLRLRDVHVVARGPAPHAVARAVPRRRAQQRRRARRRPAPARVGARGRLLRRRTRPRRCGASPRRRTGRGGVGCGPTAWWRRRSPSRRSTAGSRREPSSRTISAAWRAWSESPDAWFAILHGEIRATA